MRDFLDENHQQKFDANYIWLGDEQHGFSVVGVDGDLARHVRSIEASPPTPLANARAWESQWANLAS